MTNPAMGGPSVLVFIALAVLHPLALRGEEGVAGEVGTVVQGADMPIDGAEDGLPTEDRQRPLTGEGCKLETEISSGRMGADGVREARITFRNKGEEPIGEVLLLISAEPMSYWGNDRGGLAVFPEGEVDLYFAGADGEPFLRAGQVKTILVYHGGEGKYEIGDSICSGEGIFRRLVRRVEVVDRFGKYAPYAESSLRSLYSSEAGWGDILNTSGAKDSGEVGRRYFFSSVADSSLAAIATGIGMMAAGGGTAPDDQRGYVAETSFDSARVAFEEGDLDGAVDLLRRVLILEPENAMALNNLAYIMIKRGDKPGDASPFIEQAMKIDPSQPGFQNTMSMVRWGEGRRAEAIELARQAYLGSKGEILETKLNLVEWGGDVPELPSEKVHEGGVDQAGSGSESEGEREEEGRDEDKSRETDEGRGRGGEGDGTVSTSDTIP